MESSERKFINGSARNGSGEKLKAAIVTGTVNEVVANMFNEAAFDQIGKLFDLYPEFVTQADVESGKVDVSGFQAVFGTWGFPRFDSEQIRKFESLKHVFFGAGSIKKFGLPLLEAGISISTSKATNSKVVADFCLGQILLASKQYFQNIASYRSIEVGRELKDKVHHFSGYRGSSIALIGCGKVSRYLIEHLRERQFEIYVVDPFLSVEESDALGVRKVELEEAFKRCEIVSNHLPNLPDLEGLIEGRHFESMLQGATFMNTGRGDQVNESDLVEVFKERRDLIALLDVTEPEPPKVDSRLYELPNVLLSSHIAGCVGKEVHLLIDEAIESSEKWLKGQPLENVETLEQFNLIA